MTGTVWLFFITTAPNIFKPDMCWMQAGTCLTKNISNLIITYYVTTDHKAMHTTLFLNMKWVYSLLVP